jgi:hypothetical protein
MCFARANKRCTRTAGPYQQDDHPDHAKSPAQASAVPTRHPVIDSNQPIHRLFIA